MNYVIIYQKLYNNSKEEQNHLCTGSEKSYTKYQCLDGKDE